MATDVDSTETPLYQVQSSVKQYPRLTHSCDHSYPLKFDHKNGADLIAIYNPRFWFLNSDRSTILPFSG
jgi:hypothetical protein